MVIEVVAREVRENRHGKGASPQTVQGQRVRTGLEHGMGASGADHVGQRILQVERFRSRVDRRARLTHQTVGDRAE